MSSCRTVRTQVIPETSTRIVSVARDSVVMRTDTLYVSIPQESQTQTAMDTSFVETRVAESLAYLDHDGVLHHSIRNKSVSLPGIVSFPEHFTTIRDTFEVEKPYPVEVEKKEYVIPLIYKASMSVCVVGIMIFLVWRWLKR